MKAVNITLSILVLLMALASGVFSYFLFEKRTELVVGWGKMVNTIHTTSKTLDQKSGTKVAADLTPEKLAHENFSELDSALRKLPEQSKQVVAQRDALARALFEIGKKLRLNATEASLCDISSYGKSVNVIVDGALKMADNRATMYEAFVSFARHELGASIDPNALLRGDKNALEDAIAKARAQKKRYMYYENPVMRVIAKECDMPGSLEFGKDESSYRAATDKLIKAVKKLHQERVELQGKVNQAEARLRQANSTLESTRDQLTDARNQITLFREQIAAFRKTLQIGDDDPAVPWRTGSAEARSRVLGRVVKVDEDYGFIAIDLGTESRVKQPMGNRFLEVDPKIVSGLALVIARGDLAAGNAEFVARITLDKVGPNCSTADMPNGTAKKIQVGDIAYIENTK